MIEHAFECMAVTTAEASFTCQLCGMQINFVMPSVGSPNPIVDQAAPLGYRVPDNVSDWAGECNG